MENIRIGYIDEDVEQVKLYIRRLRPFGFTVVGYNITKDISVKALLDQVYESDIRLLMIDYKLTQGNIVPFNGDKVEEELSKVKPLFPRIIFTNKVDQAEPYVDDWRLIFDKDSIFGDNESKKRFTISLRKIISKYEKYVEGKKKEIQRLIKKRTENVLDNSEKESLLTLQQDLYALDRSLKPEIPARLMDEKIIEDITAKRKKAENFLNSLK